MMLNDTGKQSCCHIDPAHSRKSGVHSDISRCPACGTKGRKVGRITLQALLKPAALRRLEGTAYRFCPSPHCAVVYFDNQAESVFRQNDLSVRVGLKEESEDSSLCYCFDYTVGNLRADWAASGGTRIPAVIRAEVEAGHCACEVRNPQGICCLGNIARILRKIEKEAAPVRSRET